MSTQDLTHADRLRELAAADAPVALDDVLALFDALPAVAVEELLGAWSGGAIPTGHPGEGQLAAMHWAGKEFRSVDDVDPIVVRNAAGEREASPILGAATLRAVAYRGVVTATMVYDKHPVFDHFRRAGDGLLLGLMDRKGEDAPLAFYLERLAG
ncbi:MAG TPA: DUF4334 domain-containing protein [Baekduia sp.]|nr:DUF4334 domain-containing protein [Baekduia sp.]